MNSVSVRFADLTDVDYIESLCRREAEAVGFIPRTRYESASGGYGNNWRPSDRLWIAEANGDSVGFLYLTAGVLAGTAKVIQVAVQPDARRREIATALVCEAELHALAARRTALSLSVAADLEASDFWQALGYELKSRFTGGARRGRTVERRLKLLPLGLWLDCPAATASQNKESAAG